MSETPRTEKVKFWASHAQNIYCVTADFARQLERELTEAREALLLAEVALNHMGDVLNGMDAVSSEDIAITTPAFHAVRAALSGSEPEHD